MSASYNETAMNRIFLLICFALSISSVQQRATAAAEAPTRPPSVYIAMNDNDGVAGGVSMTNASLLQIIEDGTSEFKGSASSFTLKRQEDAKLNHNTRHWPKLRVTVGGNTSEISGANLGIENDGVPVEIALPGYPKDFRDRVMNVWHGIGKFSWKSSGLVAEYEMNEKVNYDADSHVYEKRVVYSSPNGHADWIIRYSKVTPAILDAALQDGNPRVDDQVNEFGYDLYLPQHGAQVEILKAAGNNIFPDLWKQWKIPVRWKCPRPKN